MEHKEQEPELIAKPRIQPRHTVADSQWEQLLEHTEQVPLAKKYPLMQLRHYKLLQATHGETHSIQEREFVAREKPIWQSKQCVLFKQLLQLEILFSQFLHSVPCKY